MNDEEIKTTSPEGQQGSGVPKKEEPEFDFGALLSAQRPDEETRQFARGVFSETIDIGEADFAGENDRKVKIVDGRLVVDTKTVDQEEKLVVARHAEGIKAAIETKDRESLEKLLWYFKDQDSEEAKTLLAQIEEAFQSGNADNLKLDSLDVVLPKRSIAERRVIKKEIRDELKNRFPFKFKDKNKRLLSYSPDTMDTKGSDNELDFVMVQEGRKCKLVVASEKGIGFVSVSNPDSSELDPRYFRYPLPDQWTKKEGVMISIPVSPAADGSEPLFSSVEVRLEPMKLTDNLVEQEEEIETETYTPKPASVPSRPPQPRASRPSSYVTTSG